MHYTCYSVYLLCAPSLFLSHLFLCSTFMFINYMLSVPFLSVAFSLLRCLLFIHISASTQFPFFHHLSVYHYPFVFLSFYFHLSVYLPIYYVPINSSIYLSIFVPL